MRWVVMGNKRFKMDIKHVLGHVTHKAAKRINTPVMIIKQHKMPAYSTGKQAFFNYYRLSK